jgi:hypothetical protein
MSEIPNKVMKASSAKLVILSAGSADLKAGQPNVRIAGNVDLRNECDGNSTDRVSRIFASRTRKVAAYEG